MNDATSRPSPFAPGPVLAALDLGEGTGEVARQADALARRLEAPLLACHVLPEVLQVRTLFPHLREGDRPAAEALAREAADEVARRVRESTGRGPEDFRVVVESGSPHAGILRLAEKERAAVTVVGHGRVAERVVRTVCCAALVARPSPAGSVLAATDFSDPAFPAVAAGAFEAERRGVGFAVMHSVDVAPTAAIAPLAGYAMLPVMTDDERRTVRASILESLAGCLSRVGAAGAPIATEGEAVAAILETARGLPAELVVLGTHGRTGLSRLALGSVAEGVLHAAPCSVLVVRLHPS